MDETKPSSLPSPWELPDIFPEKPADHPYGVMSGKKMIGCTQEEMLKRCSRDEVPPIHLVWTPDAPRLVPPAEVPLLLDTIKKRAEARGKSGVALGVVNLLLWGFGCWVLSKVDITSPPGSGATSQSRNVSILLLINAFFLGLLPIVNGVRVVRNSRMLSAEALKKEVRAVRYSVWVSTRHAGWTLAIAVLIAMVGFVQIKTGLIHSITAAALVKDQVRAGQYWRLLTCTMLHGNIFHFWFNAMALLSLGRLVEVLTDRACLVTVYFLSALGGSVASLLLLPNTTSVGASGALMGLIGFLVFMGYRRRASLPPGFLGAMLTSVFWIALVGIVAFDYIDNAAHAGGLLCGLLLGAILIKSEAPLPLAPSQTVKVLGLASTIALIVTAGCCITKMLAQ